MNIHPYLLKARTPGHVLCWGCNSDQKHGLFLQGGVYIQVLEADLCLRSYTVNVHSTFFFSWGRRHNRKLWIRKCESHRFAICVKNALLWAKLEKDILVYLFLLCPLSPKRIFWYFMTHWYYFIFTIVPALEPNLLLWTSSHFWITMAVSELLLSDSVPHGH